MILFVSWFICSTAITVNRLLNSIVEGNPNVSLLLVLLWGPLYHYHYPPRLESPGCR